MTVTEEIFDEILGKFEGSRFFTQGPYGELRSSPFVVPTFDTQRQLSAGLRRLHP